VSAVIWVSEPDSFAKPLSHDLQAKFVKPAE